MATPTKSPPSKVVARKTSAVPVKPVVAKSVTVAAKPAPKVDSKPIVTKAAVKAAPVSPPISTKLSPAPKSPAVAPPAKPAPVVAAPVAPKAVIAPKPIVVPKAPKPMPFVIQPEAPAAADSAPPAPPVAPAITPTSITPTPLQPVVAETLTAAIKDVFLGKTPQILEGNHIMNEAIETTKKFAEDAKARVQTLVTDFNGKAKSAMEKSSKAVGEINDITKGNLEAIVESSKIAAKGFESIGQSAAEYGRASFEKTSATLKSFASVKSPTEFFQLQSELLSSTFDSLASESAKTSESMLKLAGEMAQPISSRVSLVSDKIKSFAA